MNIRPLPTTKRRQIGVITITEPIVRRKLYETAAWYRDIEIPAGEYPVYYTNDYGVERYVIEYTGKVIKSNFDALFGGVVFKTKRNEDVGEEDKYFDYYYTFQLSKVEELPGFRYA